MQPKPNISSRKLERMAFFALKNALRLHLDSILLFKHGSFPSSLQMSILAMEELGKACEVEHYWFHAKTDGRATPKEEQEWLSHLFKHPWKQNAAVARDMFDYSPKFIQFLRDGRLETAKQRATYVGPRRNKQGIDNVGRIQSPFEVRSAPSRKQISLVNDMFLKMCCINLSQGAYFDIECMDSLIGADLKNQLKSRWRSRSGLKSSKWWKEWLSRIGEGLGARSRADAR